MVGQLKQDNVCGSTWSTVKPNSNTRGCVVGERCHPVAVGSSEPADCRAQRAPGTENTGNSAHHGPRTARELRTLPKAVLGSNND